MHFVVNKSRSWEMRLPNPARTSDALRGGFEGIVCTAIKYVLTSGSY